MILQCFREHRPLVIMFTSSISLEIPTQRFSSRRRGTDIHDSVAHFEGEPIVYKHEPNAFLNTDLLELLRSWEIERIVVCGMMTHLDVDATVRAASGFGFEVIVAKMPVRRTRSLTWRYNHPCRLVQKIFLAAFKSYAKVMKSEAILGLLAAEMVK